jgi:ribosomal protein L40E
MNQVETCRRCGSTDLFVLNIPHTGWGNAYSQILKCRACGHEELIPRKKIEEDDWRGLAK